MIEAVRLEEHKINGLLITPTNQESYDLIIFFHGLLSDMNGSNQLVSNLSKECIKENIATLRFDFYGSGNSDGNSTELSLTNQIEQAKSIIKYAKSLPNIKQINLCGFSMGGYIASLIAKDSEIENLILLAPAFDIKRAVNILIKDLDFDNETKMYDFLGVHLSQNFIDEIENTTHEIEDFTFTKPTLLINGTNDEFALDRDSAIFANEFDNVELLLLDEMNHFFEEFYNREYLYAEIIKFLKGEHNE